MIQSNSKITRRLDVLDGFRGILAITVVFQHTHQEFNLVGEYRLIKYLGYSFAVPFIFCIKFIFVDF
jgi:hypothetical protein